MTLSCRNLGRVPARTLLKPALVLGLGVFLAFAALAGAQTWTPLNHQPSFGASTALLLTDGTVMVQAIESGVWWRLTPDNTGSYVNGTWTQLASMPAGYGPLYYASAVLPDGRVVVEGGEYNNSGGAVWTALGAIYNPATNTWTSISPPSGWSNIGDAQSIVLANGTFMLAFPFTTQAALLNASTLTWTATGTGKTGIHDEEGWTLLPNGKVLTVDANNPSNLTNSELYDPATGIWSSAGSTIVKLDDTNADNSGSHEIGPAVLRPNGTVFATGGTSNTAVYNTATGTWSVGPTFPGTLDLADAPAALLPNGNVLVDSSPGIFGFGAQFFEFSGTSLSSVPGPPRAPFQSSYEGRMLVLPTGQILFTDGSTDVEIYTASGTYQSAWRPTISSFPSSVAPGTMGYSLSGTQLNGLSQGAMYGDDAQSATNYPLVRITNNATGHVFYAKTHNHSTMGVATGSTVVSTQFDVPAGIETGPSQLAVVANGIPSTAVTIQVTGALNNRLDHASFTFPNGSGHSFYLDTNHHVIDLSLSSTGVWQRQDLTALTGAGVAAADSALAAMLDSAGNGRVFYVGTNQHVWQLKLDTTNTWSDAGDATSKAGSTKTVAPGSSLVTFGPGVNTSVHVLYLDSTQHVNDLRRTVPEPATWSNQDVTSLTSVGAALSGSALAGLVDAAGNVRAFYVGTNQHVWQLKLDTTNTWGDSGDTTVKAGITKTVAPGSGLTSFGPAGGSSVHVLYLDSIQHVNDLARTVPEPATWSNQDVTP
jgi:hypothetical protein